MDSWLLVARALCFACALCLVPCLAVGRCCVLVLLFLVLPLYCPSLLTKLGPMPFVNTYVLS